MWSCRDREEGKHMLVSPVSKVRSGVSHNRVIILGPVLDSTVDWDSKYLSAVLFYWSGSLGLSIPLLIFHFSLDKLGRIVHASFAKCLRCTVESSVWDYYLWLIKILLHIAGLAASFIVHAHALAYGNWKPAYSSNYLAFYWEMCTCRQLLKSTLSNLL